MSDKSVETLCIESRFWSVLETSLPFPRNNVDFSFFIKLHRLQLLHNIEFFRREAGVTGELRLNANEIEEVEYRKVSFAGSVSTLLSPIVTSTFEELQANLPQTCEYNRGESGVGNTNLYTIEIGSINELMINAFADSHLKAAYVPFAG